MTIQDIQKICKEKFPIGCEYKCPNSKMEGIRKNESAIPLMTKRLDDLLRRLYIVEHYLKS